ncbi:penicillin acylase family protein [Brucellaceae bacterium C25G]
MTQPDKNSQTIYVDGLRDTAEIGIDCWGVAHLEAKSKHDGFFLQGLNAARDRLWQIDLWRKRGLGRLSASFGPGFLEQDKATRAFLYRGDLSQEYLSYSDDMEEICKAFTDGINAWIDLCIKEPERLPPEYSATDTMPEKWLPEDVVKIRSHALTRNAMSEVLRSIIVEAASQEADLLRKNIEPKPETTGSTQASGLHVPVAVLDMFKLATAGVSFETGRLEAKREDAERWRKVDGLGDIIQDAEWTGSNNWAVAGNRTKTGRPVIAGDPHRQHSVPSLRYLVHLKTPEFNVIGAGEPVAPGISMGHNDVSAFTLTIFGSDQEDIYVYDLNPKNPHQYRYGDDWEAMEVVAERFEIRGHEDEIHDLFYTRHGPVLLTQKQENKAYALRSVWWEAGTCAYLAGVATMRSRSLEEFKSSITRFGAPALNHVYADTKGTIAWLPYGFSPVRPNWDGLTPVSGNGDYEWQGFVAQKDMPSIINPVCGFVASANEMNLPEEWIKDHKPVGYEWLEKSRACRIKQVLESSVSHSVEDSCRLQTDTYSWPAMRLQKLLQDDFFASNPDMSDVVTRFLNWNCELHIASSEAVIQEWWLHKEIKPALFKLFVKDARYQSLMYPGDVDAILAALESPSELWGDDPVAQRNQLLALTLQRTIDTLSAKLGSDISKWYWGDMHHAYFEHALSKKLGKTWADQADVGPAPKAGSASTVMHAGYRDADFRVTHGASVRLVMDVGAWDNSYYINAPGQSGDPRSPFYSHFFKDWVKGSYVPMVYSDEAVKKALVETIVIKPLTNGC